MARVAPEKTCPRPAKALHGRLMIGAIMAVEFIIDGQVVIVDEQDAHFLRHPKKAWFLKKPTKGSSYYAALSTTLNARHKTLLLHREILGAKVGQVVDHKNLNSLDNRRENLRFCTQRQNVLNTAKRTKRPTSSRFKGVTLRWKKWEARIRIEGDRLTLGLFEDEVEAAYAYDIACLEHHGEFARTNFLPFA